MNNSQNAMVEEKSSLWQVMGPGILYAAAAIGVSHLVQATRAGADYGLGLVLVVLSACAIKYPSLRFGGDYAAATGESLITNYRTQGRWAFSIYAIGELFSMVFIVAAVGLFTLGLFKAAFDIEIHNLFGVSILLSIVVATLLTGKYHLLEGLTKYVVAILTLLILFSTVLVLPSVEWSWSAFSPPDLNATTVMYLVALIGFMPSPSNGSVLQSLWTCAKAESDGRLPTKQESRLDFNIGYITSVVLGLCFLLLGAGIMHSSGVAVEKSNGGFSVQLIRLFTETIGDWSFPLIATAAIFVMLSTLFTVVDGMSRIFVGIAYTTLDNEQNRQPSQRDYGLAMVLICVTAIGVLATMMQSFATFMDMTSVIVFIVSPLVAFLNHRAIVGERMPEHARPGFLLRHWSLISIFLLFLLSLLYLYFRFLGS